MAEAPGDHRCCCLYHDEEVTPVEVVRYRYSLCSATSAEREASHPLFGLPLEAMEAAGFHRTRVLARDRQPNP